MLSSFETINSAPEIYKKKETNPRCHLIEQEDAPVKEDKQVHINRTNASYGNVTIAHAAVTRRFWPVVTLVNKRVSAVNEDGTNHQISLSELAFRYVDLRMIAILVRSRHDPLEH